MSADQEKALDNLRETFVEIQLKAKQLGIDIAANISPELQAMAKWSAMILEDFIMITKEILKLAPVKDLFTNGAASFATVGDLLNAVAGKGLDVADITKQSARMGGAYEDLHRQFGAFVPEAGRAIFAGAPGGAKVTIDKHDTYVIHDAHDPAKVKDVIERHWDEVMANKTVDGFDRQLNNGGY